MVVPPFIMLKRNLEGEKKIRDRWGAGNLTSFFPNFSFLDVLTRTFGVILNKNDERMKLNPT